MGKLHIGEIRGYEIVSRPIYPIFGIGTGIISLLVGAVGHVHYRQVLGLAVLVSSEQAVLEVCVCVLS